MTARARALLLALLVSATAACGGDDPEQPPAGEDHDRLLAGWERDDQAVPPTEFRVHVGETHCDMDSALLLELRWPLDDSDARLFVRDPAGVFAEDTAAPFVPDAELPDDAVPTGYENDAGVELWLADDLATAYAVDAGTVEAWPALPDWVCA